jgi:predicted nuclease with TOPRIM domain
MTANDVFLILTWVVGISGAVISALSARRKVRADAQLVLDKASFEGAQAVINLLREQIDELREELVLMRDELKNMRGELSALRAREGKLLNRIKLLEAIMISNSLTIPEDL